MKKVFVSYSNQDSDAHRIINILFESLPSIGLELIHNFDRIEIFDDYKSGIIDQINKCMFFVCVMRKDDPGIMFELGYALAKNKKIILIGDFHDLPFDLRNMTYIPRDAQPYEVINVIENQLSYPVWYRSEFELEEMKSTGSIDLLLDRPEFIDNLEPQEFIEIIFNWFQKRGYQAERPWGSRDYGFDLLISPFMGGRAAVEVKKYKGTSQVPLSVIRQLVGTIVMERIECGIIVSTAPFSKSSEYFVQDLPQTILLWTMEDLSRMSHLSKDAIEMR